MSSNAAEIIEDAYRNPRHRGELGEATHRLEGENPLCGDIVAVEILVEDGRIREAKFQGRGCAISQAAAELMMDRVQHMLVADVPALGKDDVLAELGLEDIAPARLKCALLPLEVLKRSLRLND